MAANENRKNRILVVEDEPMTALDIEMRLQDAGYDVLGPAATLLDAERELQDGFPDLALLDSQLRGEKTYALAERMIAQGVPVLFCTGYEELEGLPTALKTCPVITKPFRHEDLMGALETALIPHKVRTQPVSGKPAIAF